MTFRQETGSAVVIPLTAEIDLTNCERACGVLDAALAGGAAVVIADLSSTRFCDCASLRHLLAVQQRAASRGGQLRLVIPAGSPVHRLASLIGLDEPLHSYPSVREAIAWLPPSGNSVQARSPGGPASAPTANSSVG